MTDPIGAEIRSFPILRINNPVRESLQSLTASAGRAGELWALHQMVFEARMRLLKECIGARVQPCSEQTVRIIVEAECRAVPLQAGNVGMVPPGLDHLVTYHYPAAEWSGQ